MVLDYLYYPAGFLLMMIYARYLDKTYYLKTKEVPDFHKRVILFVALAFMAHHIYRLITSLGIMYSGGFISNKRKVLKWIVKMSIENVLAFTLLIFALRIVNKDFWVDTTRMYEPSLVDELIEMLYFSVSTTFTLGLGDLGPKDNLGHIIIIIQLITGFIIRSNLFTSFLIKL